MNFENFGLNKKNKSEKENKESKEKMDNVKRRLKNTLLVLTGGAMLTASVEGTRANDFLSSVVEKVKTTQKALENRNDSETTVSWENAIAEKEAAEIEAEAKDLDHCIGMIDYVEKNKPAEANFESNTVRLNEKGEYVTNEEGEYVKGDCFDATFKKVGDNLMFSKFAHSGYDEDHATTRGGGLILIDNNRDGSLDEALILDTGIGGLSKEEMKEEADKVVRGIEDALKSGNKEKLKEAIDKAEKNGFMSEELSELDNEEQGIYKGMYKELIKEAARAQQEYWDQGDSK